MTAEEKQVVRDLAELIKNDSSSRAHLESAINKASVGEFNEMMSCVWCTKDARIIEYVRQKTEEAAKKAIERCINALDDEIYGAIKKFKIKGDHDSETK